MIDCGKTIADLETILKYFLGKAKQDKFGNGHHYASIAITIANATELLRSRETRVLTADEVAKLPEIAWLDTGDNDRIVPVLPVWCAYELPGQLLLRMVDRNVAYDMSKYGSEWRLWNGKPDQERREAVKWDDA